MFAVDFLAICDRTQQVQDAILQILEESNCSSVTEDDLAEIDHFFLKNKGITSLKSGDFSGLPSLSSLYLKGNQLTTLPSGVFDGLPNLYYLELNNNQLSSLPGDLFANLTSLGTLYLNGNQFSTLPAGIFNGPPSLRFLNLSDNLLTTVPEGLFDNLTTLEDLSLSDNQITYLETDVFEDLSPFLRSLSLSSNNLTVLPEAMFDNMTSLIFLGLTSNQFDAIPEDTFSGLTELLYLYLGSNQLTTLPAGVFNDLTSLEDLYLTNNAFASLLPGMFDGLTSLKILRLSNNPFTTLPVGIFDELSSLTLLEIFESDLSTLPVGVFNGLDSLDLLFLDRNRITSLSPGVFDNLTNVTYIKLQANRLDALSDGVFANLSSLEGINLENNGISTLSTGVFTGLTSLVDIYLEGNKLTSLPQGVFDGLISLDRLDLSSNVLTSLPDGVFDELSSLTDLLLPENQLATLSDGVFEGLSSLTYLGLRRNVITTLSNEAFDSLPSLTYLDLDYNNLTSLPVGFFKGLTSLESLLVRDNQFSTLSAKAFEGAAELVTFLATGNQNDLPIELALNLNSKYLSDSGEMNFTFSVVQSAPEDLTYILATDNGFFERDGEIITSIDIDQGDSMSDNLTFQLNDNATSAVINISTSGSSSFQGVTFPDKTQLLVQYKFEEQTINQGVLSGSDLNVTLPSVQGGIGETTYTVLGLGSELSFDPDTLQLSGTSSQVDTLYLSYVATDSVNHELISNFTIQTFKDYLPVCYRTQIIQDSLLEAVSKSNCQSVTKTDLQDLTGTLDNFDLGLVTLKAGDFSGLTALTSLSVNLNNLISIPSGVFTDLSSLTSLNLADNQLSQLDSGVFAGLSSLTHLFLENNQFTKLPAGVFTSLSSLTSLSLDGNANDLPIELNLDLPSLNIPDSGELNLTFSVIQAAPVDLTYNLTSDNGSFQINDQTVTSVDIPIGTSLSDNLTFVLDKGKTGANIMITTNQALAGAIFENATQLLTNYKFNTTIEDQQLLSGTTFASTLPSLLGGTGQVIYTLSGLGNGLSFDAGSRILSGNLTSTGILSLTYQAVDANSNSLQLNFTLSIFADYTSICDRTQQIQAYILDAIGKTDCNLVTEYDLADLTNFDLTSSKYAQLGLSDLTSLSSKDFSGMTTLTRLHLSAGGGTFPKLPSKIFNGLASLEHVEFSSTPSPSLEIDLAWSAQDKYISDSGSFGFSFSVVQGAPGDLTYLLTSNQGSFQQNGTAISSVIIPSGTNLSDNLTFVLNDGETSASINITHDATVVAGLSFANITQEIEQDSQPSIDALISNQTIVTGDLLNLSIPSVSGGNGNLSYSITGAGNDFVYDSNLSILSGIASVPGRFNVTYQVNDVDGDIIQQNFTISVQLDIQPSFDGFIANQSLDYFIEQGSSLTLNLPNATMANGQLNYTISSMDNTVFKGLTYLAGSNRLQGTALGIGHASFNLTATDSDNDVASLVLNFYIEQASIPIFSASLEKVVTELNSTMLELSLPVDINYGNGALSLDIDVENNGTIHDILPAGLSFYSNNFTISGYPTEAGQYKISLTLSDSDNVVNSSDESTLSFQLSIAEPLVFEETIQTSYGFDVNQTIKPLTLISAMGGVGQYTTNLTILSGSLPTGIVYNPGTMSFSGRSPWIGSVLYNYSISDEDGRLVSSQINLSFLEPIPSIQAPGNFTKLVGDSTTINLNIPADTGKYDYTYFLTLTESPDELPAGLIFDGNNTSLILENVKSGNYSLTYTIKRQSGQSNSFEFVLSIEEDTVPLFAKASTTYLLEHPSQVDLSIDNATGLNAPFSYSLIHNELLAFAKLTYNNTSNSLQGSTANIGLFNTTLSVSDVDNDTANLSLIFDIQLASVPSFNKTFEKLVANISPDILTISLPIDHSMGNGELLVDVQGMPEGFSYNPANYSIWGIPNEAGIYNITATLSDTDNVVDSTDTSVLTIELTISGKIIVDAPSNLIVERGMRINEVLPKPKDADEHTYHYDLTLKDSHRSLPLGLDFDTLQANLNGSINIDGVYTFAYTISNDYDVSVSFDFNITVHSSAFAALSRDVLTRQALIIANQITSTVKTRSKLMGKARAAYERSGNKEAINILLKDESKVENHGIALSFWTDIRNSDAQSNLKFEEQSLAWNGKTESIQFGFDVALQNALVGVVTTDTSTDLALSSSGRYQLNLAIDSPYVAYRNKDFEVWATMGSGSGKSNAIYNNVSYQSQVSYAMQHVGGRYHFQQGETKLALGFELTQASIDVEGSKTYDSSSNKASLNIFSIDASHRFDLGILGQLTPGISLGLRTDHHDASDMSGSLEVDEAGQELGWSLSYRYDWLQASVGSHTYSVETSEKSFEETSSWYSLAVTKRNELGFGYSFTSSQGEAQDYRNQLFQMSDLKNLDPHTSEIGAMDFHQQLSYGWQLSQAVVSVFSKYNWSDDSFSLENFEPRQSAWHGFGSSLKSTNGSYHFSMSFDPNAQKTLFKGKIAIK